MGEMDTDKFALVLAFFGVLAFLAFLATRKNTATATIRAAPYLLIEKNEQGRIVNVQPTF